MNDGKSSGPLTFFKRLLLIAVISIVTILTCYTCSAIKKVSSYKINLKDLVGLVFESQNQSTVLSFKSIEEAVIATDKKDKEGSYLIEQKSNVLFLSKDDSDNKIKTVFVSLSSKELLWQSENIVLYLWEE